MAWGCPQFLVAFCFIKVCKSRRQQRESQLARWKSYSFVTKSWKWHSIAFAIFHLSLVLAYTQRDRLQKDVNARRQECLGAILKVCLPYLFQFSSVVQLCRTLCNPMNYSMPGLPVHHKHPEFTQTHVYRVSDAIQPSHPLLSPSPPAPNPSQHQSLFQLVSSSHQVAKILELQLQHQCFQWIFRTYFL